jgi:hypothetical protein
MPLQAESLEGAGPSAPSSQSDENFVQPLLSGLLLAGPYFLWRFQRRLRGTADLQCQTPNPYLLQYAQAAARKIRPAKILKPLPSQWQLFSRSERIGRFPSARLKKERAPSRENPSDRITKLTPVDRCFRFLDMLILPMWLEKLTLC